MTRRAIFEEEALVRKCANTEQQQKSRVLQCFFLPSSSAAAGISKKSFLLSKRCKCFFGDEQEHHGSSSGLVFVSALHARVPNCQKMFISQVVCGTDVYNDEAFFVLLCRLFTQRFSGFPQQPAKKKRDFFFSCCP